MQRLFSTFPGSWPGLGLLVLRITVGLAPLVGLADPAADTVLLPILVPLLACLVAGFGTPVACVVLTLAVLFAGRGLALSSLLMVTGGSLSLMMLGPGAWSLDAWIYGRKRIRFDDE